MSDAELLRGLSVGDRETLRTIFTEHGDRMVEHARRVVGDGQLAEEVIQDLFVRWINTPPRTGGYTRLGAFLFVASRHAASDWIAHERGQRGLPPTDDLGVGQRDRREVDVISAAASDETRSHLDELFRRSIATLAGADRELLELRYGATLSPEECAQHLGINRDAVHKRLQRARDRLNNAIARERSQPSLTRPAK